MNRGLGVVIVAILITVLFSPAMSQAFLPFPQGLGIEVGAGYNQLLWHVNAYMGQNPIDYSRDKFAIRPTIRLRYEFYPISVIQILPFVGYDAFGGKSKASPDGYIDEFMIHALEIGVTASYSIGDLRVGVGLKYNRHFNVRLHHFGSLYDTTPRTWDDDEDAIFLERHSSDLGPRIAWVFSPWSVSAEAWFGITQLQRSELDDLLRIRERHYRILVAYTL